MRLGSGYLPQPATNQLALDLKVCDLVISNTRVGGAPGLDLIHELREHRPTLSIFYLASPTRSTPELERQLPDNVPILREPFSAEELRAVVRPLLDGDGRGARGVYRLCPPARETPGSL